MPSTEFACTGSLTSSPVEKASFAVPVDLKRRLKEMRETEHYRHAKHSADVVAYGVGCDDGRQQFDSYLHALLHQKHPGLYGGGLQHLLLDAAPAIVSDTDDVSKTGIEASYRRGWIVGFSLELERLLYHCAKPADRILNALKASTVS